MGVRVHLVRIDKGAAGLALVGLFAVAMAGASFGALRGRTAAPPPAPASRDLLSWARPPSAGPAGPADLTAFLARRQASLVQAEAVTPPADAPAARITAAEAQALASRCAPSAPASALVSIVRVESGFMPYLIRRNGAHERVFRPGTAAAAAELARSLIAEGANVDLGLAQINSRNLGTLGLSVEAAFDPCRNVAAAAEVLNRGYEQALRVDRANRPILEMAYSIYNTGRTTAGLRNGYAAKVVAARAYR
jgi:type IV secretion system protein VirB1